MGENGIISANCTLKASTHAHERDVENFIVPNFNELLNKNRFSSENL